MKRLLGTPLTNADTTRYTASISNVIEIFIILYTASGQVRAGQREISVHPHGHQGFTLCKCDTRQTWSARFQYNLLIFPAFFLFSFSFVRLSENPRFSFFLPEYFSCPSCDHGWIPGGSVKSTTTMGHYTTEEGRQRVMSPRLSDNTECSVD